MVATKHTDISTHLVFRAPLAEDGERVWQLVGDCPPLELNSPYCYLLLCTHFAGTCAVAERGADLVGFLAGYRKPTAPDVLFVWQIATHPAARGQGIARQLLADVCGRGATRFIEATVTPDNTTSRAFFGAVARRAGVPCRESLLFAADLFGGTHHAPEYLLRIGPLNPHHPTKEES